VVKRKNYRNVVAIVLRMEKKDKTRRKELASPAASKKVWPFFADFIKQEEKNCEESL
jgi:hypothetical protein